MTIAQEIINRLKLTGVNLEEVVRIYEEEESHKDAKQIIIAYYEGLGFSDYFEDGCRNEERLQLAVTYYMSNYDKSYLYKTFLKIFINVENFLNQ
jgi:hypothetical protein